MIGHCLNIICPQQFGQFFGSFSVEGINNATLPFMRTDKLYNAAYGLVFINFRLNLIIQISSVKRRNQHKGIAQCQIFYNITLHFGGSSSSEGDYGNVGIDDIHHLTQPAVFGSEIMSPFRNTVRLIYGKK